MFKVNGEEVSKEQLEEIANNENKTVTAFEFSMDNSNKTKNEPTNEGFQVDKDFIASLSESMDKSNASGLVVTVTNSSKIMGKNFYIILATQDDPINEIIKNYDKK